MQNEQNLNDRLSSTLAAYRAICSMQEWKIASPATRETVDQVRLYLEQELISLGFNPRKEDRRRTEPPEITQIASD